MFRFIVPLLIVSNCLAQGFYQPIDAFIPNGTSDCGKKVPSSEHILEKGEGCRIIIRATKNYRDILRYRVVFRPVGQSGYSARNGKFVDTRQIVSRTKIFKDVDNNGYETLRFPMRGTGEYSVIIDSNNNGYFGEEAYLGWLYRTPLKLKKTSNKEIK